MKMPDRSTPEQMNWVDYCDSLSNEKFWSRIQPKEPLAAPQHIADPLAAAAAGKESPQELN